MASQKRVTVTLAVGTGLFILAAWSSGPQGPPSCPPVPAVAIAPDMPGDVCVPEGFPGNPIVFFDDYSWRAFLAMVWPAASGQRGVADTKLSLSNGPNPLVFETFKAEWEVFQPNGAAPSPWNTFGGTNACGTSVGFGDLVLASFSKFNNVGQAGVGTLVGPLVAQNRTYVRYLTGFNQTEFAQIADQKLYLQASLASVVLPDGSIDVKSSWIDMASVQHPERYHTRSALVLDPATQLCVSKTMGLVGLHIVQKTKTRPQWIWSTFEQVDNIAEGGATSPSAFHDGSPAPMPTANPYAFPPPAVPPAPFNVQRITPIHNSTQTTNAAYQQALEKEASVWRFYKLVMTQWSTTASAPQLPATPQNTFPGVNATSAFANATMETFDQANPRTGCMNCHNQVRLTADLVWSLKMNAWPVPTSNDPAIKALRSLLTQAKSFQLLKQKQ